MTSAASQSHGWACGACGSTARPRLVKQLARGVAVTQCRQCEVSALDPMPSDPELAAHYEQYYLTRRSDSAALERLVALHDPIARWLLERTSNAPRKTILDYGFGSGAFLLQASRLGHTACGADLSRQNVRQLEATCARHGVSMKLIDLSASSLAGFESVRFDLITLFQVIEHMREPIERLRELSRLQSRGGCIYLECPNQAAALAWVKRFTRVTQARKLFWGSMKYPEHLHGFDRRSLQGLLERAGYRVEACGDYHYGDNLHQVEAETWWPRFRDNPDLLSWYGLSRSAIPVADRFMSALFHAGSGLFAFARKFR